jgi:hypothetical protein
MVANLLDVAISKAIKLPFDNCRDATINDPDRFFYEGMG